ncbi:MAG: hypothetical protein ACYC00_19070 [Eubacteriales bacterium]
MPSHKISAASACPTSIKWTAKEEGTEGSTGVTLVSGAFVVTGGFVVVGVAFVVSGALVVSGAFVISGVFIVSGGFIVVSGAFVVLNVSFIVSDMFSVIYSDSITLIVVLSIDISFEAQPVIKIHMSKKTIDNLVIHSPGINYD